jgi:hypothetical protein
MLAPADVRPEPYQEQNTGYVALPATHCSAATQQLIMALTAPFAQRLRIGRIPVWDPVAQRLDYDT